MALGICRPSVPEDVKRDSKVALERMLSLP